MKTIGKILGGMVLLLIVAFSGGVIGMVIGVSTAEMYIEQQNEDLVEEARLATGLIHTLHRAPIVISIVALLISLGHFLISMRKSLHDRYKLRCDGYMLWGGGSGGETFEIEINVTNEGRQPVSITEINFETDRKIARKQGANSQTKPILGGFPDNHRPVELTEKQAHRFKSRKLRYAEAVELPRTIDVRVKDSRGKTHHVAVDNDARDDEYTQIRTEKDLAHGFE
jgi:hypothetical protein